ncbi:hypothetical protein CS542_07300 [Pedobacter sp. IW39]|nr:hypothetical protein CS542_07300 [Pedobacter sp. IW39]
MITVKNILLDLCRIIIIMILYNLFISFTVKDPSYIYYIIYIFCGFNAGHFSGLCFQISMAG